MAKTSSHTNLSSRPPIVVVLGHVDHGKTTLLDAIRKSSVAAREAGGITQSIGASTVVTKDNYKITFVDTPGHAVFNQMRKLGARIADVAILVVAADDGVKPQTKEAIEYIKASQAPYIVAFTKTDLPTAQVENAKSMLANESVLLDGRGGDVPFVEVSGVTGKGIEELLEMISIVAEVGGIEGDEKGALDAVVIETHKGKSGPQVSAVVRSGILNVGDEVHTAHASGKVKGMFDEAGKPTKEALPGEPVQVLGFSELPEVGEVISSGASAASRQETDSNTVPAIEENQVPVVIKAQTTGALDALLGHIPEGVVVVSASVGDITESDIFMAKSVDAGIFAFESKLPGGVRKLAKTEDVEIEEFKIIYKLFERLDELVQKGKVEILGKAVIQAEFPFNKQRVAGCKVTEGRIARGDKLILMRKEEEIGKTKFSSLKKEKKDVEVVNAGEEFGGMLVPYLDFAVGDVLVSVRK